MSSESERKKILVVEDELDLRIFLCNLLGNCGYQTIDAVNREEGLQKARTEKPVLIILDVMIPKEGGIQMYRDLKREEKLKNVPVIMLSTIDKETFFKFHIVRGSHLGKITLDPDTFMEKPPEAEELLHIVRKLSGAGNPDEPF